MSMVAPGYLADTSTSNPAISRQLDPWKKKKFRDSDLSLSDVVKSFVDGVSDLVEFVPDKNEERWTLVNKKLKTIAVLRHTSVWGWATPLTTGNYVPNGTTRHPDLSPKRVQPTATMRCEVSYAMDTSEEFSLYDHLAELERNLLLHPRFKKCCADKPRTRWQSPANTTTNHRYIFSHKLFVPRPFPDPITGEERQPPRPGYVVHPTIQAVADKRGSHLVPNPFRPVVLHLCPKTKRFKDVVKDGVEIEGRRFDKQDIVWHSFSVVGVNASDSYKLDTLPVEFVRVGRLEGVGSPKSSNSYTRVSRETPAVPLLKADEGDSDLEELEADMAHAVITPTIVTDTTPGKRKRGTGDEEVLATSGHDFSQNSLGRRPGSRRSPLNADVKGEDGGDALLVDMGMLEADREEDLASDAQSRGDDVGMDDGHISKSGDSGLGESPRLSPLRTVEQAVSMMELDDERMDDTPLDAMVRGGAHRRRGGRKC